MDAEDQACELDALHQPLEPASKPDCSIGGGTRRHRGRGTPIIRFIVSRPIAPGDELLFDYGDGFELDVLGF